MGEKERQYALLGFALLFALLAAFNFLYLNPVRDEREQLAAQAATLSSKVDAIAAGQVRPKSEVPYEKLERIVEAIPVKPYTDQLIKDLERLQTLSQVEITSVTFTEQKQLSAKEIAEKLIPKEVKEEQKKQEEQGILTNPLNTETEANPSGDNNNSAEKTGNQSTPSSTEEKEQPPTVEVLQKILPEAKLNSVEMNLSIKGEYEEIYDFVSEIQGMSRYLRVDELSFATTAKDDFVIPKETKMAATIRLTSYFAPQFKSLLNKLPPVDVNGPSGKWDPLRYEVIPNPEKEVEETQKETQKETEQKSTSSE
ncbi:type 4a pilus biogenesis protein PilO [Brevibacillus sp. SYSU BS000544]|uniref:type 4a pilus biogenesis protein PilO n=1 Tax=Brevibacillus sp. SYSU BS000544 TaxID=3416443 RepID=UPI003CE544EC